ncbi:MAG TPA: dihydrodipicolinate synthase family protein, partial [Pyrinomonadaceae bacterium]|nr:dihydrodipicolinate synthase family protein [Pyrinomonadaceae bacterium]
MQTHDLQSTADSARLLERLRGVLLPCPTPFTTEGEFAADALQANLKRWHETGVVGYVALGSTGERVHLDEREYLTVLEAARAVVPETHLLIAGAGQQSVRHSIGEIERAARVGADAVLVITPHFYRGAMTQAALFDYYTAVADAAPVPVLLYSMPELTGIRIEPETIARLSQHENIIGVKDSAGDILNFAETLRLVPRDFAVLTGNGPLLYAALTAGATGAILAAACCAPQLAVEIFAALKRGAHARALKLQRIFTPLARAVTVRYGIGGLKYALDLAGYAGGSVRAPLRMPAMEARREI